jgi:hypothetical protein
MLEFVSEFVLCVRPTGSTDSDSSMRRENYDLLEKYVTHVATERVLHELVSCIHLRMHVRTHTRV